MKLNVKPRSASSKAELLQIRTTGNIPAVIYARGEEGQNIEVDGPAFQAILRSIQSGCLPTTVFELADEQGKVRKAIIKDIQYEPTSYAIWHLDFEQIFDDVRINVKVPIRCLGAAECSGVKLGGILRQVIRTLQVSCLPKDIPSEFTVDVKEMAMGHTRRLSDIALPKNVRPLADLNEVAVVVARR